jgi:hypothetical protein
MPRQKLVGTNWWHASIEHAPYSFGCFGFVVPKLDWSEQHPRGPELAYELEVAVLPSLSMSNVREMLKAVMPLKQLSPEEATQLVIKHLVNRSNSTSCRLKAQHKVYSQNHEP